MDDLSSYFIPPNPATNPFDDNHLPNANQAHGSSQSQGPSTPWTSRPSSFAPSEEIKDSSAELMGAHLHQQQVVNSWYERGAHDEGVIVKKSKGEYICCPEGLMGVHNGFCVAAKALNVRVSTPSLRRTFSR